MRFNVNQLLFAVHFVFSDDIVRGGGFFRFPLLFDNVEPLKINFVQLEVTEHHKVPNEWDEKGEKKCDGFLLKDSKGSVFTNQYPRASYGQTTDTGDRRFTRHVETREEYDRLLAEDSNFVFEYHLLDEVLENIERGIKDLGAITDPADQRFERAQAKLEPLKRLRDRIRKEFVEAYPEYKVDIRWEPAFKASTLLWPRTHYHIVASADKIKEKSKEDLVKIVNSFDRIEAELVPTKNRIGIAQEEGTYYINQQSTEVKSIQVMFLEHGADYTESHDGGELPEGEKPLGFYVCNSDLFPTDWAELAVECFLARLNDSDGGFKATNTGMRLEEISARDKAPEGIVVAKPAEDETNAEGNVRVMKEAVDKLHGRETLGDLVRQKLVPSWNDRSAVKAADVVLAINPEGRYDYKFEDGNVLSIEKWPADRSLLVFYSRRSQKDGVEHEEITSEEMDSFIFEQQEQAIECFLLRLKSDQPQKPLTKG